METPTQEKSIAGNVLLIEDSQVPMRLYQRIFENASINVYQAQTLQEAQEKLEKHGKDLDAIISDIHLLKS